MFLNPVRFSYTMKARFLLFFVVLLVVNSVYAATLHGAVYDSSLNLIKNAQLEINTTPKQSHISKNGVYFFYVPLGTYEITAERYYQKRLVYSAKKVVRVTKDGEFNIDIIMELMPGVEAPPDEDKKLSIITLLKARYGYLFYGAIAIVILLVGAGLFFYVRWILKRRKGKFVEEMKAAEHHAAAEEEFVQGADLDTILKIIREEGGRTTQREIRKKLPLSEAKVSLMITELEAKGKIEKIKKGRGNIIVLK